MGVNIIPYQLHKELTFENKKILIFTNSDQNLLALSIKNNDAYLCYKKLLKNDYILYYHEKGVSKFYKRNRVAELWQRKDLHQFNDIFYTLTPPESENTNSLSPNKLLVIFPCMPPKEDYTSSLIPKRMFTSFFPNINKYLIKNIFILRMMDLNCSHGSHFCNTINYSNMESDIQNCIQYVATSLSIKKDDIVLYGVSKGGTGALLHGSALDLKVLAVNPIIHLEEYNKNDSHFLKDFRKEDLSQIIQNNLINNVSKKYVFSSPSLKFNHNILNNINADFLNKIDIIDSNITHHENISQNCIPQQLMVLNNLLDQII